MQDWYERVAELAREALRDGGTNNSFSHDEAHARRTAELTQQIADLYGFCQQEKKFVYAAAYFHDLKRSPTEDPTVGDEKASAKKARMLLEKAGSVTAKEVEAIAYAIENHGHYPECLRDIVTRERIPEALEEKLHLVLFVADKIEQNGVRGIARGFQFMAGDHLRAEGGGWRSFGFKPDRDEALVIAIEGLLRLAFINPEGIYPSTFFMATGFHGFHVFIGTIFLAVCWLRAKKGHFTKESHFGFEAAAWYWHFVDVVWLFLFISIYWWGSLGATVSGH